MAAPKKSTTTATGAGSKRHFDADTLMRIRSAKAWRPAEGDQIEGTIVTIVPRDGEFGRYPIVVLNTGEDHLTAVHAFHGVLTNELTELRPGPGDTITIRYSGKQEHNKAVDPVTGQKRMYHGYSVVPAEGAELDAWDFGRDRAATTEDDDPGF